MNTGRTHRALTPQLEPMPRHPHLGESEPVPRHPQGSNPPATRGVQPVPRPPVWRPDRVERHGDDIAAHRSHPFDARLARALGFITGDAALIQQLTRLLERFAPSSAPILIEGESGTGKELIAQGVHRCSARAGRPLIDVNCAGMRPELLDDFLFGHTSGAFTGATRARKGKLAEAHESTLFLDELEEASIDLQVRLLRVLETGTVEPLGGSHSDRRRVDVRIVAATNRPLPDLVASGRLREDLYYRLKCLAITLPPLRERKGDIRLLANYFLSHFQGDRRLVWTAGVLEQLEAHPWPGNVRELRRCVEAACIMTEGVWIEADVVQSCLNGLDARTGGRYGTGDATERGGHAPAVVRSQPESGWNRDSACGAEPEPASVRLPAAAESGSGRSARGYAPEQGVARTQLDRERLALLRRHGFSPSRCACDPAYPGNRGNVDLHLRIFLSRALVQCSGDRERAALLLVGTHECDAWGRVVRRLERFLSRLGERARREERTALVRSLERQYRSASGDVLVALELLECHAGIRGYQALAHRA